MTIKLLIRGRPIIEENDLYYIFESDIESTPGFYTLEPKRPVLRSNWALAVLKHLEAFHDPSEWNMNPDYKYSLLPVGKNVSVVIQIFNPYSFNYKGGVIRINLDRKRVEIERNHPKMKELATELANLARKHTVYLG